MDPFHGERHHRRLVRGRPDQPRAGDLGEPGLRGPPQAFFVFVDGFDPQFLEVVGGGGEPHRPGDVRGPGLELRRRVRVGRPGESHAADHLPAPLVGRHGLEQLLPSPEDADPRGAVHLVAGHRVEVAVEFPHFDLQVGRRLRSVHDHERSALPGEGGDLPHRVHRAERVRDMHQGDDARAVVQPRGEVVEVEFAPVRDPGRRDRRPGGFGHHLPGDDVRVVLHLGEQHFVAGAERVAPEARSHQVQPFRRAPDEDHFLGGVGAEECRQAAPRLLVLPGGAFGEHMDAAMDVRVPGLVHPVHGVEHRPGFLRTRGVVQVRDRSAARLLAQDGEVGAHPVEVVGRCPGGRHAGRLRSRLQCGRIARRRASASSRIVSTPARSMTSAANARIRISRESIAPRPRERR